MSGSEEHKLQTWLFHTKLYKFGWHTSANSARMKSSRDLILGEVVYIAISYHISDSWIYLLNCYELSFDHMTGENREYKLIIFFQASERAGILNSQIWLANRAHMTGPAFYDTAHGPDFFPAAYISFLKVNGIIVNLLPSFTHPSTIACFEVVKVYFDCL